MDLCFEVLLVTSELGSTGVNLQGANNTLILGVPGDRNQWLQAACRTHRPGHREDSLVITFVVRNGRDDKKLQRHFNASIDCLELNPNRAEGFSCEARSCANYDDDDYVDDSVDDSDDDSDDHSDDHSVVSTYSEYHEALHLDSCLMG
jgi:hypothetical protein